MMMEPQSLLARAVAGAMGDLLLELTPSGICLRAEGPRSMLGLHGRTLVGAHLDELLPRTPAAMRKAFADALIKRVPCRLMLELEVDGKRRHLEVRVAPGVDGNVFAALCDAGSRLLEETRLRASEERFRVMADCAPVLLWRADLTGECDFFNRGWLEFTGRSMEEELGVGWTTGVHPEDFEPCMSIYMTSFVAREGFRMEYRLRRADGAYRWILDHGVPRFDADGSFQGFIGSCIDVTVEKESARSILQLNGALQQRVDEREVLLREVHHRVKNNLQLISSIFNLQARLLDDGARKVLDEGQTRVRSIALVHEKLCESKTMSDVDLGQYTRDLVSVLRRAIDAPGQVEVAIDIASLPISVDQAIPCGLIINELVTNSLKHAFPGGRTGSVVVEATPSEEAYVRLCVRDDGVGLPEEVDPLHPQTLGLDLVVTLARQLGAELAVERSSGTSFALNFVRWKVNHAAIS